MAPCWHPLLASVVNTRCLYPLLVPIVGNVFASSCWHPVPDPPESLEASSSPHGPKRGLIIRMFFQDVPIFSRMCPYVLVFPVAFLVIIRRSAGPDFDKIVEVPKIT